MNLGYLLETREFRALQEALSQKKRAVILTGVCEAAKPYLLAALLACSDKSLVLIRPMSLPLLSFKEECEAFLAHFMTEKESFSQLSEGTDNNAEMSILPALSDDPYDEFPPAFDAISGRMRFFHDMIQSPPRLVVTNLLGLLKPFPHKRSLRSSFLTIAVGDAFGRDDALQKIAQFGYTKEDLVNSHGEYAWRGGIVDIFSPWEENPFRMEFSGDRIVSLREFNPSTQRSVHKKERITIPTLHEFPGTPRFFSEWSEIARKETKAKNLPDFEERAKNPDLGKAFPTFPYLSLLHSEHFTPFTHFLKDCHFIIDEPDDVEEGWERSLAAFRKTYARLEKKGRFVLPPDRIFSIQDWEKIRKNGMKLSMAASLQPVKTARGTSQEFSFSFQPVPHFANKIPFFVEYLQKMLREREQCFLFLSKRSLMEKMAILLSREGIPFQEQKDSFGISPENKILLLAGSFSHGFSYPSLKLHFFADNDIFTEERVLVRRPPPKPYETFFRDLQFGDFVVHTDYGIGIFQGLVRMAVEENEHEFIQIDYLGQDKLYLPVENMDLVQKYAAVGTARPMLHKLGTPSWEKTKARVKEAAEKMAKELLELYALRNTSQGYNFSPGGEWERDFNETFEYEETEDQILAIKDVFRDMEASLPMDRLLCGDVGYGKTEVAMRAAFKAVMDGKQVAVLCPTTVLASQHWKTFQNRMALYPVVVKCLSRLQTKNEQVRTLRSLERGMVDIIIGTHRLLSKDVKFSDLGLLIIDEEQRFGVRQKEKIKQMKSQIDVLTLTATPIPRTLNISLSGLRDISLIETPPKDRLAIHTVVTPFSKKLVQDAINKEISRGGQVYFIHNRIEDIDSVSEKLRNWIPGVRVAVIHGKMSATTLENRMIDFIQHKYDVLLSTTIIENGIDIPLVNTLVVNNADRFGLAQLYQLRGRVGRSSRQAAAYFLVSPSAELRGQARERLKALQEFSELGSGFRLAAKDLEIRGAGHFLGAEQHGYVEAVGFDFYMHLLKKAVGELKGEPLDEIATEINIKVDIRIPEDYLPQMNLRLNLYKRISSGEAESDLERIRNEISDRYGPIPKSVFNLLGYGKIKLISQRLKIRKLDRSGKDLIIDFYPETSVDPHAVTGLLEDYKGRMTTREILILRLDRQDDTAFINETISILKRLEGM